MKTMIMLHEGIINKYSLDAAYVVAVLGQIIVNKKGTKEDFYDNKYWIFEDIEFLKEEKGKFKDLSLNKVKKVIKELEKAGILEVKKIDGVKGITINYKALFKEAEEGMEIDSN